MSRLTDIQKQRCEWCAKGYDRKVPESEFGPIGPAYHSLDNLRIIPCDAPSPETIIEEDGKRIDSLRSLCADAYQMAGVAGAPQRVLDALSGAANGGPHEPVHRNERGSLLQLCKAGLDLRSVGGRDRPVD